MGDHPQASIDTAFDSCEKAFSSFVQLLDVYVNKRCKEAVNILKRKELLKRGYRVHNLCTDGTIFKGHTPPISRIELSAPRIVRESCEILSCMKLRKLLRKQLDQTLEGLLNIFCACAVDIAEIGDEIFEDNLHFTLSLQNHVGLPELDLKSLLPFYIYSLNRTKYCIKRLQDYSLREQQNFSILLDDSNVSRNSVEALKKGIVDLSEMMKQTLEEPDGLGADGRIFTPKPDCMIENTHSFVSLQQAELQEVLSKKFSSVECCKSNSRRAPLDRRTNIEDEKRTVIYEDARSVMVNSHPLSIAKFSGGVCFPQEQLQHVSANNIYKDNLDLFQKLNEVYLKNFKSKRSTACDSTLM